MAAALWRQSQAPPPSVGLTGRVVSVQLTASWGGICWAALAALCLACASDVLAVHKVFGPLLELWLLAPVCVSLAVAAALVALARADEASDEEEESERWSDESE